jgi:hypothetical protein
MKVCTSPISSKRLLRLLKRSSLVVKRGDVARNVLLNSTSLARSWVSVIRRSINPTNVPASTVPSAVLRSRGSVSWAAASSNPPEPLVDMLLSSLWVDPVDVDPIRLCPSMLPDLDDGMTIIGCMSRDKSVFEEVDGSGKSMGGFNDQSE